MADSGRKKKITNIAELKEALSSGKRLEDLDIADSLIADPIIGPKLKEVGNVSIPSYKNIEVPILKSRDIDIFGTNPGGFRTPLEAVVALHRLKQDVTGERDIDPDKLEKDFLEFSRYNRKKELTVRMPRLYDVEGDQSKAIASAVGALGLKIDNLPDAIDISGSFDHNVGQDCFIFLSLRQLEADHFSTTDSYLNPLIEKVYMDGAGIIRDFAIVEPVVGKVASRRGSLDLNEINLFPDRFVPGPYTLFAELDTPTRAVKKFIELCDLLDDFKKKPDENILELDKVNSTTDKALSLRRLLGSLSRYERPKTQAFEVSTNYCVLRTEKNTLFYLYSENQKKNVLVYFGDAPFEAGNEPKNLHILRGKDHQNTLISLISFGLFEPSQTILNKRISGVRQFYDDAVRGMGKPLGEEYPNAQVLLDRMEKAKEFFGTVANPDMRREYAMKQPPELLEFMVYPKGEDPVLYELLSRLSWSKSVRNYNNTGKFISQFDVSDEATRRNMLKEVASNVLFSNQQNNDINRWLYSKYKDLVAAEGIEFRVVN